jgi:hypothetical protein
MGLYYLKNEPQACFSLTDELQNNKRRTSKMANAITTKSTTLEGQIFELLMAAQSLESATTGTNAVNRIRLTIDTDAKSITFNGALDCELITNSQGQVVVSPKVYLS